AIERLQVEALERHRAPVEEVGEPLDAGFVEIGRGGGVAGHGGSAEAGEACMVVAPAPSGARGPRDRAAACVLQWPLLVRHGATMQFPGYPPSPQRFQVRPGIGMSYLDEGPRDGEVVVM